MSVREGRAWVYGGGIDTDLLAPGYAMKKSPEELARHTLEAVDPDFAAQVRPGDMLVAGEDLGIGSSREQAAISLKTLGVSAVIAASFARIFYRNCMNIGLPAMRFDPAGRIKTGDRLRFDLAAGRLDNLTTGEGWTVAALPPHLMAMIAEGGLMASLARRFNPEPQDAGHGAAPGSLT
ncbi:3-isopropylmalate dehydratase [Alkalicaulis satelles]|uniref:3-isopropylmalate dehydratase n=1 Tax=Alkalicaulis satelles TaxID=2609175 RepID=A0A5M6ZJS7_9PROT|nr:3-isopropylmalate dehydratase [Alkalicaulis satelles]KAA5803984.1 3-isopropylmalate dehydratase [Alkalicaulis satelles]